MMLDACVSLQSICDDDKCLIKVVFDSNQTNQDLESNQNEVEQRERERDMISIMCEFVLDGR